jgi:hypothetical protein
MKEIMRLCREDGWLEILIPILFLFVMPKKNITRRAIP